MLKVKPLCFKSSSTTSHTRISTPSLLCSLLNAPTSLQVSLALFMETYSQGISQLCLLLLRPLLALRLATRAKCHSLPCLQQRQDSLHGSVSSGYTSLLLSVQERYQVVSACKVMRARRRRVDGTDRARCTGWVSRFSGFNGIRIRSVGIMPRGHGQRGT